MLKAIASDVQWGRGVHDGTSRFLTRDGAELRIVHMTQQTTRTDKPRADKEAMEEDRF